MNWRVRSISELRKGYFCLLCGHDYDTKYCISSNSTGRNIYREIHNYLHIVRYFVLHSTISHSFTRYSSGIPSASFCIASENTRTNTTGSRSLSLGRSGHGLVPGADNFQDVSSQHNDQAQRGCLSAYAGALISISNPGKWKKCNFTQVSACFLRE